MANKPKKPVQSAKPQTPPAAPGRPPGGATIQQVVTVTPSRCRKCGSTARTPYTNARETAHAGEHEGQTYSHVVWRSTRCVDCGQARKDRCLENRPADVDAG